MPFYIKLLGRYDYNVYWLRELLFPSWISNLHIAEMVKNLLFPDLEGYLYNQLHFDLLTAATGNDYNPLAIMADDLTAWLQG